MDIEEKKFFADRFQKVYEFVSRVIAINIIILLMVILFTFFPISDSTRQVLAIFYYLTMVFQIGYLHHIHKYAQYYSYNLLTGRDLYEE